MGPETDPCGTLQSTVELDVQLPAFMNCCVRSVKYEVNQVSALLATVKRSESRI